MKRVSIIVAAVLLVSSATVFAKETKSSQISWMASYDHGGDLNIDATVGLSGYGVTLSGGPEFIINQFNLGPVPLSWGIMVRGLFSFSQGFYYTGTAWGAAPMVSLHWGVDGGGIAKFDFYAAAGLGLYGFTPNFSPFNAVNFGFAFFAGIGWQFSDSFALLLDSGYVGYSYTYGLGVKLKL